MNTGAQIWMGSIEPYMTESFIISAFQKMGENPLRVKIMRDKHATTEAHYGFVHFASDEEARLALHKLKGKMIPNTNVRFKLNAYPANNQGEEYTLFVGDLSADIDDYLLFKCFVARYKSLRSAKVVVDTNGTSKGYAFIKFASQLDQKKCATEMNGFQGLGSKPIKIGYALKNKSKESLIHVGSEEHDYSGNDEPNDAWHAYTWQPSLFQHQAVLSAYWQQLAASNTFEGKDDMELVAHTQPLNVDALNLMILYRDLDFWDAIENSKWCPPDEMAA